MAKSELDEKMGKLSYALGMSVGSNLISSGVSNLDINLFSKAVSDIFAGKEPAISPDEANDILDELMNSGPNKEAVTNMEEGEAFLAANGSNPKVKVLPSGLQYMILEKGDGVLPTFRDKVRCHYHGTLIDGTVFDSSVQRGRPAEFPVSGVIQGWVEALQMMPVGSKWRLFIPSSLAYGQRGAGGSIGPNAALIFEVELLEIV